MKYTKEERKESFKKLKKDMIFISAILISISLFIALILAIPNIIIFTSYSKVDGTITKSWLDYDYELREHNGHYSNKRVNKFYRTFSYEFDGKTYTNTTEGMNADVLNDDLKILVNPNNPYNSYIYNDVTLNIIMSILFILLGIIFSLLITSVNVIRVLITGKY